MLNDEDRKMLRYMYAAFAMHGLLLRAIPGQLPAPELLADSAKEIADKMVEKMGPIE